MIIQDEFVRTLAAIKGGPVTVLLLLARLQTPVPAGEIAAALGIHAQSAKAHLAVLETHGLAAQLSGRWQVAGSGRQMVIGEVATPKSDSPSAKDNAPDNAMTATGGDVKTFHTDDAIIINSINSSSEVNLKNNNSGGRSENFTHRRGLVRYDARGQQDQSPFGPEDELAIAALTAIHVPRKSAEKAVSASPWPAPVIVAQVKAWIAYRSTPAGANLRMGKSAGQFPFLVASRISAGDLCPSTSGEAGGNYDGYLQYSANAGAGDD